MPRVDLSHPVQRLWIFRQRPVGEKSLAASCPIQDPEDHSLKRFAHQGFKKLTPTGIENQDQVLGAKGRHVVVGD